MKLSAQVSIYPLRQPRISPAVQTVQAAMKERGLEPEIGSMSTYVVGEADTVFIALQEAFVQAGTQGEVVMTITVSNACPQ